MSRLKRILVFLFLLSPLASFSGIPKDSILDFHFNYRGDFGHLFHRSGVSSFSGYLGELDATIILRTENVGLWKGGGFYVQGMNTHGKQPSGAFTQDYQVFSNIEADPHTALYEAFYAQEIKNFTFRVGQLDMNADFMLNDQAGSFINSSFGVIPTTSLNMPLSIFALLGRGAVVQWDINSNWTVKSAAYEGNPGNFSSNPHGLKWENTKGEGIFQIDEVAYTKFDKSDSTRKLTFKLGAYMHSQDRSYTNFENKTVDPGAFKGLYVTGDYLLAKNLAGKMGDLYLFTLASVNSKDDLNAVKSSFGGGFGLNGAFAKKKDDYLGLAFTAINLAPAKTDISEVTIELTYKAILNKYISIQPDIQYFLSDYHVDAASRKGLVGFVRLMFSLPE